MWENDDVTQPHVELILGIFGFGKTQIPYDMFSLKRNADEAKRFTKCANIYHKGQELAWDGREVLQMLIEQHNGIRIEPDKRQALERLFAIIMWGEMAAWKISAQLADRLEPLEARMAATSQAHDEARHFYTMYDYLTELGYVPTRMDRAPQALLDLVLDTDNTAHKLLGMQLLVETIALAIFQEVRELRVEPVLSDLMPYYERDEARHVGLGMQYLPTLLRTMKPREVTRLFLFQAQLVAYALWEAKFLEPDFRILGIDPRRIVQRARAKQVVALRVAFEALGIKIGDERNLIFSSLSALVELLFPVDEASSSPRHRARAAWRAFRTVLEASDEELNVHARHSIKTARGRIAEGEQSAVN